jgi:putative membrane protein
MIRKPMLALGLAAAMVLSATAALAQQPDKASQKFIKDAIQANLAEIDAGKLAQDKSKNDAVKEYGALMVKDHSDANEKAKQVASQLGVTPPTGASVSEKAEYLKLKLLSGATFDRSFAKGMVKDHQAVIKEFQKQAQKSDAAGAFAKETLPTLQHHLEMAQQLQKETEQKSSMR